jgi:Zinc carboxypeptidase
MVKSFGVLTLLAIGVFLSLHSQTPNPSAGRMNSADATVMVPPLRPQSGYEPPGAARARSIMESTSAAPSSLRLRAEETSFQETGGYDELLRVMRQFAVVSPCVHLQSLGQTPQGRRMEFLILSKDRAFSPEAARRGGKPVVLLQSGIHAGEIAGKDAVLMLVRDIVVTKRHLDLLDHVTVLVLPVFNVDGFERISPYNRIDQSGPREMGFRTTAQRLNLNRDFAKAESPEMQAWLRMYRVWLPELMIDNHVTDSADYQYDLTVSMPVNQDIWPTLQSWAAKEFLPKVKEAMEGDGHVMDYYAGLGQDDESQRGVTQTVYTPRYGNGYAAVENRQCMLVETHALKSYRTEVWAHYDVMLHALEVIGEKPKSPVSADPISPNERSICTAKSRTRAFLTLTGASSRTRSRVPSRAARR